MMSLWQKAILQSIDSSFILLLIKHLMILVKLKWEGFFFCCNIYNHGNKRWNYLKTFY